MNNTLHIAQIGNPILRQIAQPVTDIESPKIQTLIDDLLATLTDTHGVGMAAPQLSQSLRICIIASHPNPRYPHAPYMDPTPIINPTITAHTNELIKDWEGCLSIPGIRGFVPRYLEITAEYTDRNGKRVKRQFNDFIGRIFQHEYDHLDGVLFTDRLESNKDIISDAEYFKLLEPKLTQEAHS